MSRRTGSPPPPRSAAPPPLSPRPGPRVALAVDASPTPLAAAMERLGMVEGFDVGFEMSGKPTALRDMLAAMTHGGKIALLGLPTGEFGIDWAHLVLNMITIKGIYGRQMFETWYEMAVLIQSGVDIKIGRAHV